MQQPTPRLERMDRVAVESTDVVLLDDVHGIIRRSSLQCAKSINAKCTHIRFGCYANDTKLSRPFALTMA